MKKFDASIPRKMFWSHDLKDWLCPMCGGSLERESHAYVLAVRNKRDDYQWIAASDFGAFCADCPVVVLDRERVSKAAELAVFSDFKSPRSLEYTVVGLVNLDAVPLSKAHLPLGDDDNPVPLVPFDRSPVAAELVNQQGEETGVATEKAEPKRGKKTRKNKQRQKNKRRFR
jgi:hypothetical protein